MPDKIEVQIREGSNSGTILARDIMTIAGLKAGVDAFTIILSNEAHTVPTNSSGTPTSFSGSGTDIQVFNGTTVLNVGSSGASTFSVSASGSSVTVGSASTENDSNGDPTIRRFANISALSANTGLITFTITARNEANVEKTFTRVQTLTKSIAGTDGQDGQDGQDGTNGTNGTNGTDGDDAVRSHSGQLFYQSESASAPSAPSASGVTFNFSNGTMSGGVIGTGSSNWNVVPPAATGGASTSKTWFVYYHVTESSAGSNSGSPTFDSTVKQATSFTGLVTFNSSNGFLQQSSSNITTIDGGSIAAGSTITVGSSGQIQLQGNNQRILISD